MSLKAKLVSTIAAICMVICLLSVGVWAASTVTVNLSGSVSFVSNDVQAVVTGRIDGTTNDTEAETYVDIATFNAATPEDNPETADVNEASATWTLDGLVFKDKASTITITIKVQNQHDTNGITVAFAPTIAGVALTSTEAEIKTGEPENQVSTNVKAYYTATGTKDADIKQGGSGIYTIVLKIVDPNKSVNGVTIGGSLTLENGTASTGVNA